MIVKLTSIVISRAYIVHSFDCYAGKIHFVVGDRDGKSLCGKTNCCERYFFSPGATKSFVERIGYNVCLTCKKQIQKYKVKYADQPDF